MFGCVVAGRLVQTNLEQIDETKFVFQLPDAQSINHITVFILPDNPFPEGFGATVHFSWPGRPFQLLGGLSNLKPSAIFKLGGSHHLPAASAVVASLGISIEPVAAVESQVAALPKHNTTSVSTAIATQPPTTAVLTTRIVRNLYNFLTGYAVNATQINASEQFVPLRAFQEWHSKFTNKLQLDPSFLETDRD